jgi:hypothetical protein
VTKTLNWHSKFNVYSLQTGDILLLSEFDSLVLPALHFSAFRYIDGVLSVDQIIVKLQAEKQDVAIFLYQLENIQKQRLLVSADPTEKTCFVNDYCSVAKPIIHKTGYSLVDLTMNGNKCLMHWVTLLDGNGDRNRTDIYSL